MSDYMQHLRGELAVLKGAPISVIIVMIVSFVGGVTAANYVSRQEIETLTIQRNDWKERADTKQTVANKAQQGTADEPERSIEKKERVEIKKNTSTNSIASTIVKPKPPTVEAKEANDTPSAPTSSEKIKNYSSITSNSAAIPASIRLQFNGLNANPVEIQKSNIDTFKYMNQKEEIKHDCPSQGSALGQIGGPFTVPLAPSECQGFLLPMGPKSYYTYAQTWVFFISFKLPVRYTKIDLDGHGANLPKWELAQQDSTHATIWFHGDLPAMVLDIKTIK